MQSTAKTVVEYIDSLEEDRRKVISELRKTIKANLPKGFEEELSYGMIGYVVPFSIFPGGYHCNPKLPLPFINIGSQKNFVVMHHMGVYANPELLEWFVGEYPKHSKFKLDMGKGCIRFKKMDDIPYALIGELATKIDVKQWTEYCSKYSKK